MHPNLVSSTAALEAKATIFKGSKSFSLASLFFSAEEQAAVHLLYAWCRYTDDQIDEATDPSAGATVLSELRQQTRLAFTDAEIKHPVFRGLQIVVMKYRIPHVYAEELLNGYEMDLVKKSYDNFHELDLYCYRVAGVVGLMMCHIMGLSDTRALRQATRMGMAMQLTNIARDVQTDFQMGRVYLPADLLREFGVDPRAPMDIRTEPGLMRALEVLIRRAETMYREADEGLLKLPWRAAVAVASARWIYSEIGRKLLQTQDVRNRTVVGFVRKLALLFKGVVTVAQQLPHRLKNPFQPAEITSVWSFKDAESANQSP